MSRQSLIGTLAEDLGHILLKRQWYCAVAESCTGGELCAAITAIAGSSQWFDRGFITYTNAAKHDMLGVPEGVIASHGAVSEATVMAMAKGVIAACNTADVSIAISGIAGPDGGGPEKPVGTVWIAWDIGEQSISAERYLFLGDRESVRKCAVEAALCGLVKRC